MPNKNYDTDEAISKVLNDPERMTKIIQSGIKEALRKHKLAGNPICEWRGNKVVWIQPENIPD